MCSSHAVAVDRSQLWTIRQRRRIHLTSRYLPPITGQHPMSATCTGQISAASARNQTGIFHIRSKSLAYAGRQGIAIFQCQRIWQCQSICQCQGIYQCQLRVYANAKVAYGHSMYYVPMLILPTTILTEEEQDFQKSTSSSSHQTTSQCFYLPFVVF